MTSKYTSSKSVAKNQTVPINASDPRLSPFKIGQTKARQGAEIDIIGLDGKSLIQGGAFANNISGITKPLNSSPKTIVYPTVPANNEPPKYYPGGSGPFVIIPTAPTDVTAVWSGEDLVVSFNWDYKNQYNATVSQFVLEITADGVTRRTPTNTFAPNKTQTAQTFTLTKALNRVTFGLFRTGITSICVLAADPLNNISTTTCAATVPTYVLDLPTPVITTTAISNGYSVAYTTPTQSSYDAIDIWEIEDSGTTAPVITYSPGTTTPTNYKRSYFSNMNPANVITQNYNKRWVIARFSSSGGTFTAFCAAQVVTPTSPVSVDNTPPDEVTQITTSWSGDNIVINYKLPSQVALRASRIQIELTSPNSLVGFFYRFPDGSGRDQTTTITKKDLFDQFGEHYSSFTGILRSIDSSDNRTSGVSFNVDTRPNPMATITPTFTLTPLTNGYSVFASNYATTVSISYMEVYAKHTPWVGDPLNDDDIVYSGANPAVVIDTDYTTVYVKIHYYDDFGNTSLYSIEDTVVPLGPGEITSFETPITFGTNGVIYAGGDYASGHRTVFKTSGIFAYDSSSTSPTTGLTTQIISEASSGTPTFITTRAQIADWNITDTKIENDLSGTPSKYTGLSATGTYAFWAGSDVSGGNSSSKFTVTPTGEVTAREITIIGNGGTGPLISAGGLFTVKNDGSFTATGADIQGKITADSGEFTGNVKINGGSLYSPKTSGIPSSSNAGVIFNGSGVAAFNGSGGYAEMLTTALADGSVFATTAANIGGWQVNTSQIKKTSIAGKGNIVLDSSGGYIYVSDSSTTSHTAGINSPGSLTSVAFWSGEAITAGAPDPGKTQSIPGASPYVNNFVVRADGTLYAHGANIYGGSISSTGALGNVTIDGTKSLISLSSDSKTSYLIPRNGNIYLTSPGTALPWGTADGSGGTSTEPPTDTPYFVAGSSFKDSWNNDTAGIGMFTGEWDYFTNGISDPFITLTKSTTTGIGGIQLSAGPEVGMLIEQGNATGDAFAEPTILIYTASDGSGSNYSPSTTYGAWATFQENIIKMSASDNTFIHIDGAVGNKVITLQASPNSDGTDSPYTSPSKIVLSTDKVQIFGLTAQGNADIIKRAQSGGTHDGYRLGSGGEDLYPLGAYGRQRMIVQNEYTGELLRGMAVYYSSTNEFSTTAPTSATGVVGDLFVVY